MDDRSFILRAIVITLGAVVVLSFVGLLIYAFNAGTDPSEVIAILGASLETTLGCFVMLLGGRVLDRLMPYDGQEKGPAKSPPPGQSSNPMNDADAMTPRSPPQADR